MTNCRRAVIFDLYGTLVDVKADEKRLSFWKAVAADCFGKPPSVSGRDLRALFFRLAHTAKNRKREGFLLDRLFATLLAESDHPSSKRRIKQFANSFRRHSLVRLKTKPYVSRLLERIRTAGYKVGLISNTEALLTQYDLRHLALEDEFDQILLSSSVGVKKPDSRIFREMLARLKVKCGEAVFVGDNFEEDILGALRSGIDGVYVTRHGKYAHNIRLEDAKKILRADFRLRSIIGALREHGFSL